MIGMPALIPTIDHDFIPKYPSELLNEGSFAKVPIITGTCTDEGFGPGWINSDEEIIATLVKNEDFYIGPHWIARELVSLYSNRLPDGSPYGTGNLPSWKGGQLK
jgi:acetylcholinesterase